MNLSETAFLVPIYDKSSNLSSVTNKYYLRWWTPVTEVKFCGHATLASVHLLYSKGFANINKPIEFQTKDSGIFLATKPDPSKDEYLMNFPALSNQAYNGNKSVITNLLNMDQIRNIVLIVEAGDDLLIELENVDLIEECSPAFGDMLEKLGKYRCVIITAASIDDEFDFKSRGICPACGINGKIQ
eukprot:UN06411